jgi:hypothetical protein
MKKNEIVRREVEDLIAASQSQIGGFKMLVECAAGSVVVTGSSSLTIPFRGRPENIEVWFADACDINLPHTCSPMCPDDEITGFAQPLPHHRWGLTISWHVLDRRTRQAYWNATIQGSLMEE